MSSSTKEEERRTFSKGQDDELFKRLQSEGIAAAKAEPCMKCLLESTVLHPTVKNFSEAISRTVSFRLSQSCGASSPICPDLLYNLLLHGFQSDELENGHTMLDAVGEDGMACVRRDPACDTLLEVLLYFKGFASLVLHRAARRRWKKPGANGDGGEAPKTRFMSLWLQSQASAAFGVDIHPGAEIGAGVMFDHGTGVVVGETAKIGDGCTILHGVTLGGTGKEAGDRHPKVGRDVLIGAGTSILGNIRIGDGAKIGAGSIVLKPIPHGATAVGAPAKIIGWARESRPGTVLDLTLLDVVSVGGDNPGTDKDGPDNKSDSQRTSTTVSESTISIESGSTSTSSSKHLTTKGKTIRQTSTNRDDEKLPRQDKVSNNDNKDSSDSSSDDDDSDNGYSNPSASNHSHTSFGDTNSLCVWRNFRQSPKSSGMISFSTISELLSQEGATEEEIGEVYFALLKISSKSRGCIPANVFYDNFSSVAQKYTTIDKDKLDRIGSGDRRLQYSKSKGLCKVFKSLRHISKKKTVKNLRQSLSDTKISVSTS